MRGKDRRGEIKERDRDENKDRETSGSKKTRNRRTVSVIQKDG
jgi:hypothetical protein